ncbi:cysteine-rich with EGF-like domain protein 2 isoform X2 [Artemia franciscana]|uniref:EGF-like domain-containing protein n=1 Tax=Artemia franciscana TaxID=6661 RepID=A0AA88HEQ8_ARTSF|nr:hypothetical protein QYM36_017550 [Artemia franciscana]
MLTYVLFFSSFCFLSIPGQDLKIKPKSQTITLPPCQACKNLVGSFTRGMERTSRGKFEGGNTDWEETRLGSYATSEVRFVEIQEKLCKDVIQGEDQCHLLADENEDHLEEWWKNQRDEPDLHKFFCIERLKACCPVNHYGPECKPCLGGVNNPCFGNGDCKGNGTRKGNGKCICHKGYTGELCNQCAVNYFPSYQDERLVLCTPCHKSCSGGCSKAGPEGCESCTEGWIRNEGRCYDIDECLNAIDKCDKNSTFCVNTEGNYTCAACDKVCKGCDGDGPDMCKECAEGFEKKGDICIENENGAKEEL